MSYTDDFLNGVIENRDLYSVEMGWFSEVMRDEYSKESYQDALDFLEGKLDLQDVEFVSAILTEVFPSQGWNSNWSGDIVLFKLFDFEYDDEEIYKNAQLLMQYNEFIGLPDDWGEKLEKATYLDNFKQNYNKIKPSDDAKLLSSDRVKEIIMNKEYNVLDTKQVEVLANLVYYMFDDEKSVLGSTATYDATELWNRLAINAELDNDVLDVIESGASGWYAENVEEQFDKVDMYYNIIDQKRAMAKVKADNQLTEEDVERWIDEYKGVLEFSFSKGFVGLEDQRNDSIIITFNGEEIYKDIGSGNSFGDTSLLKTPIEELLKKNDYKTVSDIFVF